MKYNEKDSTAYLRADQTVEEFLTVRPHRPGPTVNFFDSQEDKALDRGGAIDVVIFENVKVFYTNQCSPGAVNCHKGANILNYFKLTWKNIIRRKSRFFFTLSANVAAMAQQIIYLRDGRPVSGAENRKDLN